VDAVLHFGGISTENPFEPSCRPISSAPPICTKRRTRHGVKRVVFASSNHTVGFYRTTDMIDADMPPRPDSFYGVSKCFGERCRATTTTASAWRRSACASARASRSRQSAHDGDLPQLRRPGRAAALRAVRAARRPHHRCSACRTTTAKWWDNRKAAHLGYKPKDSSAQFAHLFPPTAQRPPRDDAATIYQGGAFVTAPPSYPLD
jgi:uronate dehydrogenase